MQEVKDVIGDATQLDGRTVTQAVAESATLSSHASLQASISNFDARHDSSLYVL